MSLESEPVVSGGGPARLVQLGFGLTLTWLVLGFVYIASAGWSGLQSADALGSFLEGAFAPLAFLWLVIGYFLQQSELSRNTRALERQLDEIQRQSEHVNIQSRAVAASERHARQQAFLGKTAIVQQHLGSISGLLYLCSHGATANGQVNNDQVARLFSQKSMNDHEVFSRSLLIAHLEAPDPDTQFGYFYGTAVRARHSNNFAFTFERLLEQARIADPDGLISDAILGSGHGFLYSIIKAHQARAPAELADVNRTGRDIRFGSLA